MTRYQKVVAITAIVAVAAVAGMLAFTTASQAASSVEDAASRSENNSFTGIINWFKKGVKIGVQGTGGVTYFNGTITNNTTKNGKDVPVTFGDNVRIDGRIFRGPTQGPGDSKPVIIDDDLEIKGSTTGIGISNISGLQTELDGKSGTSHDHIGQTWTSSVSANSMLNLINTGNGAGLGATTSSSSSYPAIIGTRGGSTAAIGGYNTESGPGVTGTSVTGHGVYAKSTSGYSMYVDGKVGINAAANKAVGTSKLSTGASAETITNTAVTSASIILLSVGHAGEGATNGNTNGGVRVVSVTPGVSFLVHTMDDNAASADIPYSYLIIN